MPIKRIASGLILVFLSANIFGAIDIYIDRVEPERFNPAAKEGCVVYITLTEDAARFDIEVRDFRNNVVHTRMLTNLLRGSQQYRWDGLDTSGAPLPDGDYRIEVIARDSAGNSSRDFQYVSIASEAAASAKEEPLPVLPELTAPALKPSGYFRSVGRGSGGEETYWEHRAQVSLDYNKEALKVFARGDLRYTDSAGWENDNSELGLNWDMGKLALQVSFRDQLGSFGDPLQLYSNYSQGRMSYGLSLASKFEGVNFNIVHSRQEDSKANSTAMRVTADLLDGLALSGNWVLSIDENGDDSSAYSVDASVRLSQAIDISAEAAASTGGSDEDSSNPIAYRLAANYRAQSFSASVGWQDIAAGFRADSAYLPNGTSPDNHGLDLQLSYRANGDFLFFEKPSLGLQLYNQATEAGEDMNEYRGNLRFNLFKIVNVGLDYQYTASPEYNRQGGSVRLGAALWSGGNISTRFGYTDSAGAETYSFYTDMSFRLFGDLSLRLSHQYNSQKILSEEETTGGSDTSSTETWNSSGHLFRLDTGLGASHFLLQYRLVSTDEGENNFYMRFDQALDVMERFNFTVYAAYGDLVSASSAEQFEAGIEMRF